MSSRTRLLFLSLVIASAGCSHRAQKFAVPPTDVVKEFQFKVNASLIKSRQHQAKVRHSIASIESDHQALGAELATTKPMIDVLWKIAPAELRPDIQAIGDRVATLATQHNAGEKAIQELKAEDSQLGKSLEQALENQKLADARMAQYFQQVQEAVDGRNQDQQLWAEESKKKMAIILWYRLHFWLSWIIAGAGLLVIIVLSFLKATGRLAMAARP